MQNFVQEVCRFLLDRGLPASWLPFKREKGHFNHGHRARRTRLNLGPYYRPYVGQRLHVLFGFTRNSSHGVVGVRRNPVPDRVQGRRAPSVGRTA